VFDNATQQIDGAQLRIYLLISIQGRCHDVVECRASIPNGMTDMAAMMTRWFQTPF